MCKVGGGQGDVVGTLEKDMEDEVGNKEDEAQKTPARALLLI